MAFFPDVPPPTPRRPRTQPLEDALLGKETRRRITERPDLPAVRGSFPKRDPKAIARLIEIRANSKPGSPSYKAATQKLELYDKEKRDWITNRQFEEQRRNTARTEFSTKLREQPLLRQSRQDAAQDRARRLERSLERVSAAKEGRPVNIDVSFLDLVSRNAERSLDKNESLFRHIAMGSIWGIPEGATSSGTTWENSFKKHGLDQDYLKAFEKVMENLHDDALEKNEWDFLGIGSLNEKKFIDYAKRNNVKGPGGSPIPSELLGTWFRHAMTKREQHKGTSAEDRAAYLQTPGAFPGSNKHYNPVRINRRSNARPQAIGLDYPHSLPR